MSHGDENIAKQSRCRVRLFARQRRLIPIFAALIMEPDLMRSDGSGPIEPRRRESAYIVEPRRLVGSMAISRLPNLAGVSDAGLDPSSSDWLRQAEARPCAAILRVLENATERVDRVKRSLEAATIIAGKVVVSTPTGKVYEGHIAPPLAWWMSHNRVRPTIEARVSGFVPRINAGKAEV